MAFLLSPKTGGGVTYALASAIDISVNGGEARTYDYTDGVTVSPGDIVTCDTAMKLKYYDSIESAAPISEAVTIGTRATIEEVAGAAAVRITGQGNS